MYLSLLLLTLSRVLTQQISKMPIFYSSSVCRLHINSQTFCHLVMTRNPGAPQVPQYTSMFNIHGHSWPPCQPPYQPRQCHHLPICFLTSDLTIRNKNQRNLIVRRAGLSISAMSSTTWPGMEKAADAADTSVLFFSAGANL